MTDQEFVLDAMRRAGKTVAESLQSRAADMTGTAIYAESDYLPDFDAAVKAKNMLDRPAGFVCRAASGRAVKLLQPYDSTVYTQQPEELPAQWGFYWSKDPAKALPFIALSTSPYMTGDCCTENGVVYQSLMDNNVHSPTDYPQGWEEVSNGS